MDESNYSKYETKIEVRQIEKKDIEKIIELAMISFPNMDPWEKKHLESHIKIFPEGQLCVEYEGVVVGSSSSLLIDFDEYEDKHTFDEITDNYYITNHDPRGKNLYGIEIMVHPEYRDLKIGQRLYEARKELARSLNLESIVIGGRIPNYHKYSKQFSPREYVKQVSDHKIYDPVLSFQLKNGFVVKRINANYLEDDLASMKYATLMEWNNIDYSAPKKQNYTKSFPIRICVVQYMLKKISSFYDFAQQCEYFVNVGSSYKSDFVVFPENLTLQLLSYLGEWIPAQQVKKLTQFTDEYIELFVDLAVKYNVNIIGGSHFVEEKDNIYNVSYLFRRDGTIEKQYKIHITPNEKLWWGIKPGNKINVFDTDCGKIAIQICYDIQFPELGRIATDRGARIIFTPFCTDDRQGYLRVRYCAQARAIENQIFTVICGTVGNLTHVENMDVQYAESGIFSPSDFTFARDGIVGQCNPNIETIIIGDVDTELLRRARISGTVTQLKNRRSDLYGIKKRKRKK